VEAKQIAKPVEGKIIPVAPESQPGVPRWTFVKQHGVAEMLRFKDGSKFQFRRIETNDRQVLGTSHVTTTDIKLANNLRSLAKTGNFGVVEVTRAN
jgi:hypothetical protein